VNYSATQDVRVVRRYYSGTNTLRKGQILHYDQAATKTATDVNTRLGSQVTDVAAANIKYFAGVVDGDAGKVGPCFVELLQPAPGDVIDVEVDGTTDVAAGDLLEPDNTKGCLIKATAAAGDALFVAFEANTTDSTKTVNRCQRV
jgi:phage baseplate assembly protein gpV